MARGVTTPAPMQLPKVSFVKVQDDVLNQPTGVHDQQARSYGYNDSSDFVRPDHYIRYIEPLESELLVQVEYDMDEQDQEWLDTVNLERKKEQIGTVSYETFEIIMDRLEKEWFDLTKNIPKPDLALPSEDSTCAICDDSEGENTNAIVFCDGCNLAVHQDCYGVPYIPEGQWLCRKCTVSPENPVSCSLCPNEGGAFKQTTDGEWCHLLCAIWVPETRVANDVFMEPITGIDRISKSRWKLKCSICDVREGACIQCNKPSCFLAFHATCARKERLLMPMKSSQGSEAPSLAAYCERHLPKEQADAREVALKAERNTSNDHDSDSEHTVVASPKSSKTARAYAKTYKPGPPLVPHIIVQRLLQYIARIPLRQKDKFVLMVCRYWSLKREARRGAPLLKRLHLEPWTMNSSSRQQSDEHKEIKIQLMKRLRDDLDRVRTLATLCFTREKQKLNQSITVRDVLSDVVYPHAYALRNAYERITMTDRNDYFKSPVSKVDVPDYYDIIQRPMCWSMIENKLDQHEYWDLEDFKRDIKQVVRNAMTYNKPGTAYYKTAQNINNKVDGIFADLDKYVQEHSEISSTLSKDSLLALFPPLCNLEPPLPLLELLASEHPINEEMELVLSAPPLESLFTFEFPVFKPPPVTEPEPQHVPSKPKKTKSKSKKQKDKDLDSSPGFRAPARNRPSTTQLPNEDGAVSGPSTIPETQVSVSEPVGEEDVHEDPAVTKTSKKPRRPPLAQPGQEPPHVVEDVDKQDLFKMFNQGWVLSAGHKRGGRVPVERGPVPPPKKRQRVVEREKSHLSTLSTSIAENDTLRTRSRSPGAEGSMRLSPLPISEHQSSPQPAVEEPKPDPGPELEAEPTSEPVLVKSQEEETIMSIDDHHQEHPEVESSNSSSSLSQPSTGSQAASEHPNEAAPEETTTVDDYPPEETAEVSQPQNMAEEEEEEEEEDTGPPRIIIIEELDTPATRREKNIRKKAERERAKAAARATEFAQAQLRADTEPIAGPSHPSQPSWDADSELSSLSGLSDEEEEPSQELRAKIDPQPSTSPAVINLGPGEKLQEGTLVWAKCKGNPWWPAVVFDRDSDEVDPELLEHPLSKADQHHLVRFFDSKRSWDWLPPDKLLLLHEDKALDEDMLAAKSKRQTWKVYKKRAQVRQGYKEAIAEMETSS